MSDIQPRNLTNRELLRIGADLVAEGGMPVSFQLELLRRFNNTVGAPNDSVDLAKYDPRQLSLPL